MADDRTRTILMAQIEKSSQWSHLIRYEPTLQKMHQQRVCKILSPNDAVRWCALVVLCMETHTKHNQVVGRRVWMALRVRFEVPWLQHR